MRRAARRSHSTDLRFTRIIISHCVRMADYLPIRVVVPVERRVKGGTKGRYEQV